eukprot:gene9091-11142_t
MDQYSYYYQQQQQQQQQPQQPNQQVDDHYGPSYVDPRYQSSSSSATPSSQTQQPTDYNNTYNTKINVTSSVQQPTSYDQSSAYDSYNKRHSVDYSQQQQQQQQPTNLSQSYTYNNNRHSGDYSSYTSPTYNNRHSGDYSNLTTGYDSYANKRHSGDLSQSYSYQQQQQQQQQPQSVADLSQSYNHNYYYQQQQQQEQREKEYREQQLRDQQLREQQEQREKQIKEQQQREYEESWRVYYEQQRKYEAEQERLRNEEMERIKQQQQKESERLQQELQKQRDEVERMKQDLIKQQHEQKLKGEESQKQLEMAKQNALIWQQEEMKRQMIEIQRERELAKKHEEQTRIALLEEQRLAQSKLKEQQEQLRNQQLAMENKLRQEESLRLEDQKRKQVEMKQREERLLFKNQELESMKKKMEEDKLLQTKQMESKQKLEYQKQLEEFEKRNQDLQKERMEIQKQKQSIEDESKRKKSEYEMAKQSEEKKLKEQQDHIKRQQELIDIQQKELKLQMQESKQRTIDSLQPMRDMLTAINVSGGDSPKSPSQIMSAASDFNKKAPAKLPPPIPASDLPSPIKMTTPPIPSTPPPSFNKQSAQVQKVEAAVAQVYKPKPLPVYSQKELDAILEGKYRFGDVIRVQRIARKWLTRRKFRRIVSMKFNATDPETEQLKKRYKAVNELYSTEVSYLNSLLILQNFYFIPMEVEAKVTKAFKSDEIQKIFSNLRSLVQLSTDILHKLEDRLSRHPILIGDIFVKFAPIFKIYVEYVNNFDNGTPVVKQLIESPQGSSFFAQQKTKSRSTTDINSLLIMPVQRMPRYELLLKEILKHTQEDHVEYKNIKSAFESIRNINQYINERKKNVDSRSKLLELQKEIKNAPELIESYRYFVRDGPCVISSTKKNESGSFQLFFFNDMILATKKTGLFSLHKYEYIYTINLTNRVDVKDIESHDSVIRIVLGSLDSIDVVIYTISFSSKKEKDAWLSDLNSETKPKQNLLQIQNSQRHL